MLVDEGPDGGYLGHLVRHEGLASEARFHRHHQDQLHFFQEGQHSLGGGGGLEDDAGLLALGMDFVDGGMEVFLRIGLHVDGDQVRSRIAEGFHIPQRADDHQMHVQGKLGGGADGLYHGDADGDVGHEQAVHHVHVDIIGGGNAANVPLQVCKVGGENGWCYFNHQKRPLFVD